MIFFSLLKALHEHVIVKFRVIVLLGGDHGGIRLGVKEGCVRLKYEPEDE